jgi:hypothetical protein
VINTKSDEIMAILKNRMIFFMDKVLAYLLIINVLKKAEPYLSCKLAPSPQHAMLATYSQ